MAKNKTVGDRLQERLDQSAANERPIAKRIMKWAGVNSALRTVPPESLDIGDIVRYEVAGRVVSCSAARRRNCPRHAGGP